MENIKKIENFIKSHNGEYSIMEIWRNLPENDIKFDVFNKIFDDLKNSNKIIFDNRKIVWIFNPELKKELLKDSIKI